MDYYSAYTYVLLSNRRHGNGGIRTLDTSLPVYTLSKRAHSATLPRFLNQNRPGHDAWSGGIPRNRGEGTYTLEDPECSD
jgi:hypothetical protein